MDEPALDSSEATAKPKHRAWQATMKTYWRVGVVAAGCFLLLLWMVTEGSWNLFERKSDGRFYDAQAKSFLQGRWDVPYAAIASESFKRDGKHYGYFGPTPALPRIPLMLVAPGTEARWARISMLFACLLNLFLASLLYRAAGPPDKPEADASSWHLLLFLVAATIGSTTIFMASSASMYHEAIMWGNTLALLSYYLFITYWARPGIWCLLAAGLAGALSFFARVPSGLGPLLIGAATTIFLGLRWLRRNTQAAANDPSTSRQTLWNAPSVAEAPRHLMLLLGGGFVVVGVFMFHNHCKFGNAFEPKPIHRSEQYAANPARLERIQGKVLHGQNAIITATNYLSPTKIELNRRFPWIHLTREVTYPVKVTTFDYTQYYAGVPAAMPALFLLSCLGFYLLVRRSKQWKRHFLLASAGALASAVIIFFYVVIEHRYLHDLYPFMVLTGAVGARALSQFGVGWRRKAILSVLLVLAVFSACANLAFAYEYQRAILWSVPEERRQHLRNTRAEFAAWLDEKPLRPVNSDFDASAANHIANFTKHMGEMPVTGQLWAVKWNGQKSLYYFNGTEWAHIAGRELFSFPYRMKVAFSGTTAAEPILSIGRPGDLLIYARHEPKGRLRFIARPRYVPEGISAPQSIQLGSTYKVDVKLDVLNRRIQIDVDGKRALTFMARIGLFEAQQVRFGKNDTGHPDVGEVFSGRLTPTR